MNPGSWITGYTVLMVAALLVGSFTTGLTRLLAFVIFAFAVGAFVGTAITARGFINDFKQLIGRVQEEIEKIEKFEDADNKRV